MTATLVVLVWWAVLAAALVGVGAAWPWQRGRDASLAIRFWAGLVVTLGALQIWHVVRPIDGYATATFLALGGVGLALAPLRRRDGWRLSWPAAVVGLLGVVWLANRATAAADQFDSLIYHLHATEWVRAFPIVPGLGNLHDRLALNNASFLLAALMEPGPLRGQSSHFLNGLLLAGLAAHIVSAADRLWRGAPWRVRDGFAAILVYPLINDASHYRISSLGTDLPSHVMMYMSVWTLLERDDDESGRGRLVLAVALAGAAACMKLTALPFTAAMVGVVGFRLLRAGRTASPWRAVRGATVVLATLMIPWMARGVVMSGYPFYPLALGRVPMVWAVPPEVARAQRDYVEAFAKTGDHRVEFRGPIGDEPWIGAWVSRQFRIAKADIIVPAVLLAAGLGMLAVRRRVSGLADVLAALGLVVVIWFTATPHPRFGGGVLWVAAAAVASASLASMAVRWQRVFAVAWVGFALATLLGPAVRRGVVGSETAPSAGLLVPAAAEGLFHVPRRIAEMQTFRTASGLEMQVPVQGPGGWRTVMLAGDLVVGQPLVNTSCWPGPLLRTPYPNPALKLRDPASPGRGFLIDRAGSRPALLDGLR